MSRGPVLRESPPGLRKPGCRGCDLCRDLDDAKLSVQLFDRMYLAGPQRVRACKCPRVRYTIYAGAADKFIPLIHLIVEEELAKQIPSYFSEETKRDAVKMMQHHRECVEERWYNSLREVQPAVVFAWWRYLTGWVDRTQVTPRVDRDTDCMYLIHWMTYVREYFTRLAVSSGAQK